MPDAIRDGKGRGNLAGVNSDNQLTVRATSVEQRLKSAVDENYYEATTGQVTLTNATETGIFYMKNNSDNIIVIDRVFYDIWDSTSGSGSGTLKYYVSPTVAGGTDITPTNTNFGSTNTADVTAKKSLSSISGTVWWTAQFSTDSSYALEEGRIVLPTGSEFAISIAAPTGNTSLKVSVNVAFYEFDKELLS